MIERRTRLNVRKSTQFWMLSSMVAPPLSSEDMRSAFICAKRQGRENASLQFVKSAAKPLPPAGRVELWTMPFLTNSVRVDTLGPLLRVLMRNPIITGWLTTRGRILVIRYFLQGAAGARIHSSWRNDLPHFVACVSTGMQKLVVAASKYGVLCDVTECIKMT